MASTVALVGTLLVTGATGLLTEGAGAAGGDISTVAGAGTLGYSGDGGAATSAQLGYPGGVALDRFGNLYISDSWTHSVRKVDTSGVISPVAGAGWGYSGDGGAATSAQLSSPEGVAVDGLGNLYIADTDNHRVRKVDAFGVISTVAGTGTPGHSGDGGAATSAWLNRPAGVAVDGLGNLYIADTDNQRVRKVDHLGTISTVAGTGIFGYSGDGWAATSAKLAYPRGVAMDGSGNLYIADNANQSVRKVDRSGVISTVAGTLGQLASPEGVAVDGFGNLYIGDAGNHRVLKVDTSGVISTVAGTGTQGYSGDGGAATSAQLAVPEGVALDGSGNLYIGDTYNHRVRKVEAALPLPPTTPPPIGNLHPSNDCVEGTNVVDGFFEDSYVKLRTSPRPADPSTTWVCVAADSGGAHVGGKVKVASTTASPPVDDNHGACDANPTSRVHNREGFVGPIAFDLDVNIAPDATWVCFEAVNTLDNATLVAKRVVVSSAAPSAIGFDPDSTTPFAYPERPNPGTAASACQTATSGSRTRLVNAEIGTAHVWLYTLAESGGTRQSVCLRGQSPSVNPITAKGERLTVDGNGTQTFVTVATANPATDFGVCDLPVFGLNDPAILLKARAGVPAHGCVTLGTTSKLITVTPNGTQSLVTRTTD